MTILLICPVLNRKTVTARFIEQIEQQMYKDVEIVFVDGGSTDGTLDLIRESKCCARFIQGNSRWWWAKSINEGIKYIKKFELSDKDIVGFINDDVIMKNDYLWNVNEYFTHNSDILGSTLINDDNRIEYGLQFDNTKMQFKESKACVDCCSSRGLFLRNSTLNKIGLMRNILLPHYFSDYDFTLRATKSGISINYYFGVALRLNPQTHSQGNSTSQNNKIFSNSNPANVLRRSTFIFLHCKNYLIPKLLIKEIWNLIKGIYRSK